MRFSFYIFLQSRGWTSRIEVVHIRTFLYLNIKNWFENILKKTKTSKNEMVNNLKMTIISHKYLKNLEIILKKQVESERFEK